MTGKDRRTLLKKALTLAVDGTDLQELRKMIELDLVQCEKATEAEAKVFEARRRVFAHHRHHRRGHGSDPGHETPGKYRRGRQRHRGCVRGHRLRRRRREYFFLPAANKLKARGQKDVQLKELLLEGVSAILEGMNPKLIRVKLEAFVQNGGKAGRRARRKSAAAAAVVARG